MTKIILDACNNHLGNKDLILKMIQRAGELGADYIKFQLYNPDKLNKNYPNYEHFKTTYEKCMITSDLLEDIFEACCLYSIKPMFTIFSADRLRVLDRVVTKLLRPSTSFALKIASPDMSNYDLISKCRAIFPHTPLVISCGMHSPEDIEVVKKKYAEATFLYCISQYPTLPKYVDFKKMQQFDGFSDHTQSTVCAKEALRNCVGYIEMHFTLSREIPGNDAIVSKNPEELEDFMTYKNSLESIDKYKKRWTNGE